MYHNSIRIQPLHPVTLVTLNLHFSQYHQSNILLQWIVVWGVFITKKHLIYFWGHQTPSFVYGPGRKALGSLGSHQFHLTNYYQIFEASSMKNKEGGKTTKDRHIPYGKIPRTRWLCGHRGMERQKTYIYLRMERHTRIMNRHQMYTHLRM